MDSETTTLANLSKLWAWAEQNWRRIATGAAALALVALVAAFMIHRRDQNALAASEALSALRPTPVPGGGVTPVPADAYLKVASTYPGTQAAGRARLLAGAALYDAGKYAEAQTQFESFQREFADSPLRPEAIYGLATCLEAQGKNAEALSAFQAMLSRYASSPLANRAKLAMARAHVALKQPKDALRLLEEVRKNEQFSLVGMMAEILFNEVKAANPGLVEPAAPPAATATVTATNAIQIQPAPAPKAPAPAPKKS